MLSPIKAEREEEVMKRVAVSVFAVAVFFVLGLYQPVFAQPGQGDVISGKVVETMDSAGYTYVCLEKNKVKTWVAVPQMKVQKGKQMSFQPGMVMENFESKTLKRKFDKIVFSGGPVK